MILPCEIGVKTVLPAVKAIMAKQIIEKHGLTEQETAKLLGLSQSAISRYLSKERGNIITLETSSDILILIEQMVTVLIKEPSNKTQMFELFCQTCEAIRKKGLMCPHCQGRIGNELAQKCFLCL